MELKRKQEEEARKKREEEEKKIQVGAGGAVETSCVLTLPVS